MWDSINDQAINLVDATTRSANYTLSAPLAGGFDKV
jgi:hypothetical protein